MTFTNRERQITSPELIQDIENDLSYFRDRLSTCPQFLNKVPNPLYYQYQMMINTLERELGRHK